MLKCLVVQHFVAEGAADVAGFKGESLLHLAIWALTGPAPGPNHRRRDRGEVGEGGEVLGASHARPCLNAIPDHAEGG